MKRDEIFASPIDQIDAFRFDEKVVSVFPDMINRSVPGYGQMVSLAGIVASSHYRPGSRIYDLGCSLGSTAAAVASRIPEPSCRITLVDNSSAMIDQCRSNLAELGLNKDFEFMCQDIRSVVVENASVVCLVLTLQFIPVSERNALLNNVYNGLNSGGILLLAEKISFDSTSEQEFLTSSHEAFKRANGYSELEISQKRSALENVLVTESALQHEHRLRETGFDTAYRFFQAYNFVAWAAHKR
ncbi:MAG: carboxy-S-adenosyl-L-methionine synthase CmoA [Gammaproteobacteria bacterium]|nr:carboxy-S-adenosyl-L-methionine synthase CmoA [Gammaproteobacteria bacterium]